MIAIDLSKQQAYDADPRAIQQINFIANLDRDGNTTMFFYWRNKRNRFGFFTRDCKSFVNTKYSLIFINIKWHNTIA